MLSVFGRFCIRRFVSTLKKIIMRVLALANSCETLVAYPIPPAENSPTGTGTLSPLPGHQRSIGRSSSLGDIQSFFDTVVASPKGTSAGGGEARAARRRADTGGLLERVFLGVGIDGSGSGSCSGGGGGGSSGCSDGDDKGSPVDWAPLGSGHGSTVVSQVAAFEKQRRQQRQDCSPRPPTDTDTDTDGDLGVGSGVGGGVGGGVGAVGVPAEKGRDDDSAPPAVSRMKGKKPPRVPRMKRMASAGDGSEGGGGKGKGGVCKVS